MNKPFWLHLLLGPLLLFLAILFKSFPPKQINWTFGYRTSTSMKSQEIWEEANRYSANLMILAAITTILFQIICYKIIKLPSSFMLSTIFLMLSLGAMIFFTELHLRKNFDKEGKRKIPIEQQKDKI